MSESEMKLTDWEVKGLAIQIYAHMVSNPRKSSTNSVLARDAILAAIDFQLEWNQHGRLKQKALTKVE